MTIGERTAEEIKFEIGSAMQYTGEGYYDVKGRDMVTGLPKNVRVSSSEIRDAMAEVISEIVEVIKMALEETPPELAGDIIENGIILTGGGALIRNMDRLVSNVTGIPVLVSDNPLDCVAAGTGKALESIQVMSRSMVRRRK